MKRICKGKLYAVTFDDHTSGDETYRFTVYGRAMAVTRTHLTIGTWVYTDSDLIDDNVERSTIVRRAVVDIRELSERDTDGQS